jgi:Mor family transcriptional regulator
MPSKLDKIPIANEKLDKRYRLTEENKKNILNEYETGSISITALGKKYNVSKRTIQFILFPERKELVRQQFLERRKDGRYYDKEKHRQAIANHREHKKNLFNQGLLGEMK